MSTATAIARKVRGVDAKAVRTSPGRWTITTMDGAPLGQVEARDAYTGSPLHYVIPGAPGQFRTIGLAARAMLEAASTELSPTVDNSWADSLTGPTRSAVATPTAQDELAQAMGEATLATQATADALPSAVAAMGETLDDAAILDVVAWAQAMRRTLLDLEAAATAAASRDLQVPKVGTMADGRTFTVKRSTDRKAWDHDGWKHDARAALLESWHSGQVLLVDGPTGEVWGSRADLLALLASAQGIHGAGAPKVSALKALGLSPDDYCETSPGRWSVTFTAPGEPAPEE